MQIFVIFIITQSLKNIFHEIFVSIDNSKCYKHRVSLALNNKFTGVFQAIVSVLHSLHHLRGVAIAILHVLVVVFQ